MGDVVQTVCVAVFWLSAWCRPLSLHLFCCAPWYTWITFGPIGLLLWLLLTSHTLGFLQCRGIVDVFAFDSLCLWLYSHFCIWLWSHLTVIAFDSLCVWQCYALEMISEIMILVLDFSWKNLFFMWHAQNSKSTQSIESSISIICHTSKNFLFCDVFSLEPMYLLVECLNWTLIDQQSVTIYQMLLFWQQERVEMIKDTQKPPTVTSKNDDVLNRTRGKKISLSDAWISAF